MDLSALNPQFRMNTSYKKYVASLAIAATITSTSLAVALPAFAQTNTQNNQGNNGNHAGWMNGRGQGGPQHMMSGAMKPAVFGLVTGINGTSLTVESRGFGKNTATTTYSVNASGAIVIKNNATSSLSSIALNDRIIVEGTVSGTSVTATTIRDGIPMMMRGRGPDNQGNGGTGQTPLFKGNGEPVVAGTVSAVTGNSLSITTSSNTSYTIDATNATVKKDNATSSVSAIATNDYVVVQGTVNGSSVIASTILDNQPHPASGNGNGPGPKGGQGGGVFGAIGSFFKHLFGF